MLLRRLIMLVLICGLPLFSAESAERRTAVVEAVAKARAAVVNIRTEQIVRRRSSPFFGFGDSIFDQFFSEMFPSRSYQTQSLGSGVIINPKGYILTNAHVINKASRIYVALPERRKEHEATLVGKDSRIDLAVLKIEPEDTYPYLNPARSDDLLLGESVIAIGNPLGLGHSITTGVISSTQRRIPVGENYSSVFIQSDTLINPGNSGGPLININGELIGINTAIARQAQGIGFSIPIDTAKRVLNDLIEHGRVRRAFLGVVPGEVGESFTRSHGEGGILIEELLPDSPAQTAGVRVADVILAIDGVAISSAEHFYSLLQTYTPDDQLQLRILRGLKEIEKRVALSSLPEGYLMSYTRRVFGFDLTQTPTGLIVKTVRAGSSADKVGIRRGDLIGEVDRIEIGGLSDFKELMEERLGKTPIAFTVVRGNRAYLIELP